MVANKPPRNCNETSQDEHRVMAVEALEDPKDIIKPNGRTNYRRASSDLQSDHFVSRKDESIPEAVPTERASNAHLPMLLTVPGHLKKYINPHERFPK